MITEDTGAAHADLDDDALFENLANPVPQEAEAPVPPAAEAPVTQEAPETVEVATATETAAQQAPEAKEQPQEAHRVPLRELLDERDRRQAEARRAEALERELQQLRAQAQKPAERPDFWEKPEDSIDYRIQQNVDPVKQLLVAQQEQFSRALAENKHGAEAVEAAFADLAKRFEEGDPTARIDQARAVSSGLKMYDTLVSVHRERQLVKEVGSDPAAYKAKLLEEALNDPAFMAKALERAKASASPVINAPPKSVGLPSVSRMGAAAAPVRTSLGDLNDDDLFDANVAAIRRG